MLDCITTTLTEQETGSRRLCPTGQATPRQPRRRPLATQPAGVHGPRPRDATWKDSSKPLDHSRTMQMPSIVKKFLMFGVQMNFPASAALSIRSPRTQFNGAASHWETKGRHPCLGPPLPSGSRTAIYNQVLVDLRRPPPSPIPPVALLGPQALPKEGGAQHHAGRAIVSLHPKQPPYLPSNSNSNSRGKESRGQPA